MLKNSSILICLLTLFTGCAARYQESSFFSGGFTDERISSHTFVVTYNSGLFNNENNPAKKDQFIIRRAAELTLNSGFTHFTIRPVHDGLHVQCHQKDEAPETAFDAQTVLKFQSQP